MATKALATRDDWTETYAEWLAVQPKIPSKDEKQAKATLLAGKRQQFLDVQRLEKTPAFQQMVQGYVARQMDDAKAKLRAHTDEFLQGHIEMFRYARDAKDYQNSIKYTQPIVDRIWGKAEDHKNATAEIHLHFGTTGFAAKYQEPLDTDYEVIVTEGE